MILQVKKLYPNSKEPTQVYDDDVGYDLYANLDSSNTVGNVITVYYSDVLRSRQEERRYIDIEQGKVYKIGTGIAALPESGYFCKIEDRSGMGSKGCRTLAGLIDKYTGEFIVVISNVSNTPFKIYDGDKFAQFVIHKKYPHKTVIVDELEKTERGANGFGSSGQQ